MRILWVKSDFLHPTTKGGHIRTLEMLKHLHYRNEVHYVAFDEGLSDEGVRRSTEYCRYSYPVPFRISSKNSWRFYGQMASSILSPVPIHVSRPQSAAMWETINGLIQRQPFDALVCDFLTPVLNLPDLPRWVLFQHNVESMIWQRRAQNVTDPVRRWYVQRQADLLTAFERRVCQTVKHVVAVSEADADHFRLQFNAPRVSWIPTGVDIEYFTPPPDAPPAAAQADLIFVGSMDWNPNVDGLRYFQSEILPLIRRERPGCSLLIVGREPTREILAMAEKDPLIQVTGTVPDVRPYLWGAQVSLVPLRIGGGTRLKIYESMAARVPVVSTTVGAEGLHCVPGENIELADDPPAFARSILTLLNDAEKRQRMAAQAWDIVNGRFGWAQIAGQFEQILARPGVQ